MKIKYFSIISVIIILFLIYPSTSDAARTTKRTTTQPASQYRIPSRAIIVSPYVSYIFAKDLYIDTIEDQSGFGGGINISTQIYKNFGYILDIMYTNLEIIKTENVFIEDETENDLVAIYSGGFYYALPEWKFDMCYGAITAGDYVMTIFIPSIEYYRSITSRLSWFAKLSYLITNDWIVDLQYEEKYTSFALSAGLSIVF